MRVKPCIDIVLPSCNGARFIRDQIRSIQDNIGYTEYVRKLIVVDDASDDDTLNIVYKLAHADPSIEVVSNSGHRRGVKKNIVSGLSLSMAPLVMLSDQDDIWKQDKLRKMLHAMEQAIDTHGEDTPLLGFSDLEVVDAQLNPVDNSFWHYQGLQPRWANSFKHLLCQNVAPGCSMVINRPLIDKALPFLSKSIMHDWGMILVACQFGHIFYLDDALVKYRQHGNNQVGAQRLRSAFRDGVLNAVKRARKNVYMLSAQACSYHAVYGTQNLEARDIATLRSLMDLPTMNSWSRLAQVFKGTIRKNNIIRNLFLIIVLCTPSPQIK